jgi:hypothetical protein
LLGQIVDTIPAQVSMAVEKAGEQGSPGVNGIGRGLTQISNTSHGLDLVTIDLNDTILDHGITDAGQYTSLQDEVLGWRVVQGLYQFLKPPGWLFRHRYSLSEYLDCLLSRSDAGVYESIAA